MHWISLIWAHSWQQFYTAGNNFTLQLANILRYRQQLYTAGSNFTLPTAGGSSSSDKYHLWEYLKIEMNVHKINKRSCANFLVFHIFKVINAMLMKYPTFFPRCSVSILHHLPWLTFLLIPWYLVSVHFIYFALSLSLSYTSLLLYFAKNQCFLLKSAAFAIFKYK